MTEFTLFVVSLLLLAVIALLGAAIVVAHRKEADAWTILLGFGTFVITFLTFLWGHIKPASKKQGGNALPLFEALLITLLAIAGAVASFMHHIAFAGVLCTIAAVVGVVLVLAAAGAWSNPKPWGGDGE